jgi:very-short-patch-repair endonuclease
MQIITIINNKIVEVDSLMDEIKLELVKSEEFLGVKCDFYRDQDNNIYMTREQIGQALQYSNPQKAIDNIHSRNKERLDKFSVMYKLKSSDGKYYNTLLYSKEGIMEICKLSSALPQRQELLLRIIGCTQQEINLIIYQNNQLYKQNDFYNKLSNVLHNICKIEREVKVLNYRVDFLINRHIIIECDELGHKDRNKKYEIKREQDLINAGYKILRFNPDGDDIFEFINKLLILIKNDNDKLKEWGYITA